jgi:Protein of unknown function (DUF5818)
VNRELRLVIALTFSLLLTPLAFSQDAGAQPCPEVTAQTLGCELVAWSHLQEPVPLPEPDAKPTPPDQQSDPQQSPSSQSRQPAPRQGITGNIVKQGEKYVLKAGDHTTYQLDDQNRAAQFQDKQVTIVGKLDVDSNTLRIENIQLTS